jgi:hypothetical protein
MQRNRSSITKWVLLIALVVMSLPVTAFAQRRWVVVRPRRNRVVIYQPQPPVIYQRSYANPYYGYTQPYYQTQYYSYGYQQPYSGTTYYSSRYSQPYVVNRYTYSRANSTYGPTYGPTYGYAYREYRPRPRSRVRFGVYIR